MLDILPEALEMVDEPHLVFYATLVGFCGFFILERVLMRYVIHPHVDHHSHTEHTESLPALLVIGDTIHNFLDGIVIAIAYVANPVIGLTTTMAVAAHEIPQEIGDFSVLLSQGWSKRKIVLTNIAQSLMTIPGIFVGYYGSQALESYVPYLLAGAAGVFLYLGASDLIPELHHRAGHKHLYRIVIPFVMSIVIIGYLTQLAHHHA